MIYAFSMTCKLSVSYVWYVLSRMYGVNYIYFIYCIGYELWVRVYMTKREVIYVCMVYIIFMIFRRFLRHLD